MENEKEEILSQQETSVYRALTGMGPMTFYSAGKLGASLGSSIPEDMNQIRDLRINEIERRILRIEDGLKHLGLSIDQIPFR